MVRSQLPVSPTLKGKELYKGMHHEGESSQNSAYHVLGLSSIVNVRRRKVELATKQREKALGL